MNLIIINNIILCKYCIVNKITILLHYLYKLTITIFIIIFIINSLQKLK